MITVFVASVLPLILCNKIDVLDYKLTSNPTYVTANVSFTNDTGGLSANFDYRVIKTLNLRIMVQFNIYKFVDGRKTKALPVPKFNYCDARKRLNLIPLVSDLINDLILYGNATATCPILPGYYNLEGFPVDSSPFVVFFPAGMYIMHIQFTEENRKRTELVKVELKVLKN